MAIPILAYHAANLRGCEYPTNDHVAFATDLEVISRLGWRIVPLHEIVDDLFERFNPPPAKTIAITFDDGSDFDFYDLEHPDIGMQRSMLNIMRDFAVKFPNGQPSMHATSFVVASPLARSIIDRACFGGRNWMSDAWWNEAVASRLLGIGNHSWDHNHESLPAQSFWRRRARGIFFGVNTSTDADAQILQAAKFIAEHAPESSAKSLFCYPYGHVNDYLAREYLPQQFASVSPFVTAAFSTDAGKLTRGSNRWNLPRYVCGYHWKSPDELVKVLSD